MLRIAPARDPRGEGASIGSREIRGMSQQGKKPSAPPPPPASALGAVGPHGAGFGARIAPNVIGFFSSGAVMVLELVAGRLVCGSVGSSQYTWTSIIGVILAGMSLGNWYGGRLADRYKPGQIIWILFLAAAGLILLTIPLNWALDPLKGPFLKTVIENPTVELGNAAGSRGWGMRVLFMMSLVWILPALALGLTSPVLAKMAIDANPSSGRAVGTFYTWGAVGMILATVATGFFLVSLTSVHAIIVGVAGVMALLGGITALPQVTGSSEPSVKEVAR